MVWMTRSEKSKALKKELCDVLKPKSKRLISVKSGSCGYSSYIDVYLKDVGLDIDKANELALKYNKVDRCEVTGEVLEGANTYINVYYKHGWRTSTNPAIFDLEYED